MKTGTNPQQEEQLLERGPKIAVGLITTLFPGGGSIAVAAQ